jgi:type I restriction enzyme M protein
MGSAENGRSKVFDTIDFGYRKITVERPLRLNFQASPERIARLQEQNAFRALAESKKKDKTAREKEEKEGRHWQAAILTSLRSMPDLLYNKRKEFEKALDVALDAAGKVAQVDWAAGDSRLQAALLDSDGGFTSTRQGIPRRAVPAPLRKAILAALSERDEMAEICMDKDGNPEPDPDLRDTENVPLKEDITIFFEREVQPHVPDAWINTALRDPKDGQVGRVGYEINFNRYFYEYQPPRPLEEIEADIKILEKEIMDMLRDITNSG